MSITKNVFLNSYSSMKKQQQRDCDIFWLWKSDFSTFLKPPHYSNSQNLVILFEYNWFLAKNLFTFVSLTISNLKTPQPVLPYWGPLPVEVLPAKNSQFFFFFTKLLALCAFYSEGQLLNGKITLLYGGNTYRVSSHIFIIIIFDLMPKLVSKSLYISCAVRYL